VLTSVLGASLASIDSTVVSIALPSIGRDLHAGFAVLQWTITGYTLTLAALMLLGGALGDQFGRRRIFVLGVAWFAVASLGCAAAPSATWLIIARTLQGVGGALLTPGTLAIIEANLIEKDRGAAIGAWSGLSGVASAVAPFLGGWLLAWDGWRWVFLVNPLLAAAVLPIAVRHVPETRDPLPNEGIDVAGSALGVLGLGGLTAAAISASDHGLASPTVLTMSAAGVGALISFVVVERRSARPMVPPGLFRSRQFSTANAVTFLLYAANAAALVLLVIELQTVSRYSPLQSGAALLPVTVIMLLLSSRFGARGQRIGPRRPMALGPCISAAGLMLTTRLSSHSGYLTDVLPAVSLFGFGLAVSVAPLTSTVLAAVPAEHAGVASGINNAVARAAGLLAIALLPAVTGLTGDAYESAGRFLPPFRAVMWICAALEVAGGALAGMLIRNGEVDGSQSVVLPQPPDAGFGNLAPAAVDGQ
jgi:EmrB/QacA subfamily drug resistance transporter